jgi:hypothetical protein
VSVSISADGTAISYTKQGSGAAVILVGGALDDGSENAGLADALAADFTVINYSRRGRGESGDTLPYDVQREIEDLAALTSIVGGASHVYGVSSGAALALRSAAAGVPITKLGLFEAPYPVDSTAVERWRAYRAELNRAEIGPGEMVAAFMQLAGSAEDEITVARHHPVWRQLMTVADTLRYDAACLGDGPPTPEFLAKVRQPVLVATGALPDPHMGSLQPGYFAAAADLLVRYLPRAERHVFAGQSHVADPALVATELRRFFGP